MQLFILSSITKKSALRLTEGLCSLPPRYRPRVRVLPAKSGTWSCCFHTARARLILSVLCAHPNYSYSHHFPPSTTFSKLDFDSSNRRSFNSIAKFSFLICTLILLPFLWLYTPCDTPRPFHLGPPPPTPKKDITPSRHADTLEHHLIYMRSRVAQCFFR